MVRLAGQGYWTGGKPPYGLQRLLLDETREPLHVLEPGQRKGIQNQRVTLVEGAALEVAVIRRIFHEFVDLGYSNVRLDTFRTMTFQDSVDAMNVLAFKEGRARPTPNLAPADTHCERNREAPPSVAASSC